MTSISQEELFTKFRVVRVLGEGSFGKVFLIRNIETHQEYAMKKYSKYHLAKNGKELSLIRSVRILKNLSNSGVIDFIYFVIGKEDQLFLIFEACKKGSLEDIKGILFKNKCYQLVKQIMYQIAKCLYYLKSVSVAHRDIKPSNITFNSKGELKVIDFDEAVCFREDVINQQIGFSKQFSQEIVDIKLSARRSRANSYVGTEKYMSPEMRQRTSTDERGDLWAFGCILFELVQGESIMIDTQEEPFMHHRLHQYLEKVHHLDPSIKDLLLKILILDPNRRITIEQILSHKYFSEYRTPTWNNKKQLKKFLRGNYNLMDPRTVVDALEMDLIGMRRGEEVFQSLKRRIRVHRKATFCQWLLRVDTSAQYTLVGGGKYFKLKADDEMQIVDYDSENIYIFYDEIDGISIKGDSIEVRCSTERKHLKSGRMKAKEQKTEDIYEIKDGNLGPLFESMLYIWND